jgi:microcystin-dependent protein
VADPFIAEIRICAFNFAPFNWALCNGQLLSISQQSAMYSLIGTYYGGDGRSNFALPDMQGNVPMSAGSGPGLSVRSLGEIGGDTFVTLQQTQMPIHNHSLMATAGPAETKTPGSTTSLAKSSTAIYTTTTTNLVNMAQQAIGTAGSGVPHNNMQPYLTMNFCICMVGVYPTRG